MLDLINFEKDQFDSTPVINKIKPLNKITFLGLFNSFDLAHRKLEKLKEQGSIDILTVKKDLIKARDYLFQIYLSIDSILHSYKTGFGIKTDSLKCDFCPDIALTYREFHKWCNDCFSHEFGGKTKKR